jgi:hypothetical protein
MHVPIKKHQLEPKSQEPRPKLNTFTPLVFVHSIKLVCSSFTIHVLNVGNDDLNQIIVLRLNRNSYQIQGLHLVSKHSYKIHV